MRPGGRSVIVLGGGVIGLASALSLLDRGFCVTICDPGGALPPASWGNAGRIAVEQSAPLASLATLRALPGMLAMRGGAVSLPPGEVLQWLPFGLRLIAASMPHRFARGRQALGSLMRGAIPAWRALLGRIGAPDLLVETGHYSVWENVRKAQEGQRSWLRDSGAATACDMDPTELERLRVLLAAPVASAMAFTGTAAIADPGDLLHTMRAAFAAGGGLLVTDRLSVAQAAQQADVVVVAAGTGSADLLRPVGHRVPIIAERGYHIQQAGSVWPIDLPPIFFEDRGMVVTQFRSALRATSFVEFTRADAPPDSRKWRMLRRHARELGLPFDDRATQWYGSRPTLPDYLPAIGQSRRQPNLYYAFGHQHLGLTLAAITGEAVAAIVTGSETPCNLTPFELDRFG
jgi:D-amino-acid dehydrogenase